MSVHSPQSFPGGFAGGCLGGVTAGAARPRYAQLIYTSFDDGSGSRGGWQIKDEAGDLTGAERHELTMRIVTRFDVGRPLPFFPTPTQIDRRPSRLVYAMLGGDAAGYWHTVDSGRDATGRPGNVFAHVVLDRRISAPSALRPIQLWGSSHWLRPYNSAEVAAATLTGDSIPEPSGRITAAAAITFLTGTTVDRQSVFRVLLDAVYAAMSGGPGVLLITGDLDSGPRWLAAISFFMSPGTARRFSWSTHDDPELAAADFGHGIHLVVVARERAAEVPAGRWIAIDEHEEPSIGQLGSAHGISCGEVTVAGWSVLAEGVLSDEFSATRLLDQQDAIAAELGDHDLTPVWPLAIAVRQDEELCEFHADADQIIADDAPRHASIVGWIGATVALADAATAPTSVDDAHDRFLRAHQRGSGVAAAARCLLRKILSEPEWILSGPLAEVPVEPVVDLDPFRAEIADVLDRLVALHPPDSVQSLHAQLRIIELLNRIGCAAAPSTRESVELGVLIDPDALGALAESVAARPLLEDTAIGISLREKVLRPALAGQPAHLLDTFDLAVWQWLFGDHGAAPIIPSDPQPYDAVLLPRYLARVLEQFQRCSLTMESASQLAHDGIYLALAAEGLTDDDCRDMVSKLSASTHLTASELTTIFSRWPQRIRPAAAIAALYYEALPAELIATIADIPLSAASSGWDQCAVATARLRALYRRPRPWRTESVEQALREFAPMVLDNLPRGHVGNLADDLIEVLAVLFTVGQTRGEAWCDIERPIARELRQVLSRHAVNVVDPLADMVENKVIDLDWFVAKAVMGRINENLPTPTLFSDFTAITQGRRALADLVVSELIKRSAYQAPTNVPAVRDAVWPVVRRLSAEHAEIFFSGYSRAARAWLEDNSIGFKEKYRSGFRWMG